MRRAHVVIDAFTGVASEVIKNVVLAGIGKLTIVDARSVQPEDLSASFFFRPEDVGTPRIGDAPLQRIKQLNPHVHVDGVSHQGVLSEEAFERLKPDVVLVTQGKRDELIRWNDACRKHSAMFFAAATHGLSGFIFCDLLALEYVEERPVAGAKEKVPVRYRQEFVPLRSSLESRWSFRPSPGLLATWALWSTMDQECANELKDEAAFQGELEKHAQLIMDEHGVKTASVFRRMDAQAYFASFARATFPIVKGQCDAAFAPTSAILGGIVAQSVLNALGRREEPIVNWCILDASRGTADIHSIGPPSAVAL